MVDSIQSDTPNETPPAVVLMAPEPPPSCGRRAASCSRAPKHRDVPRLQRRPSPASQSAAYRQRDTRARLGEFSTGIGVRARDGLALIYAGRGHLARDKIVDSRSDAAIWHVSEGDAESECDMRHLLTGPFVTLALIAECGPCLGPTLACSSCIGLWYSQRLPMRKLSE